MLVNAAGDMVVEMACIVKFASVNQSVWSSCRTRVIANQKKIDECVNLMLINAVQDIGPDWHKHTTSLAQT